MCPQPHRQHNPVSAQETTMLLVVHGHTISTTISNFDDFLPLRGTLEQRFWAGMVTEDGTTITINLGELLWVEVGGDNLIYLSQCLDGSDGFTIPCNNNILVVLTPESHVRPPCFRGFSNLKSMFSNLRFW